MLWFAIDQYKLVDGIGIKMYAYLLIMVTTCLSTELKNSLFINYNVFQTELSSFRVFIWLPMIKSVKLPPYFIMWLTIFSKLFVVWMFTKEKDSLATYVPTQLQSIRGHLFMLPPCVIPYYKIIPIKNYVRAQDDNFSGFYRLLETVKNN